MRRRIDDANGEIPEFARSLWVVEPPTPLSVVRQGRPTPEPWHLQRVGYWVSDLNGLDIMPYCPGCEVNIYVKGISLGRGS